MKATWIIWASLDTLTLTGMFLKHTVNGQIIGAVTGAWIVAALALKYGESGWTKTDKLCLKIGVVSLIAMVLFPVVGILTSLTAVFVGSFPTFQSAWKDPSQEDKLAWTIFWTSCLCSVAAIPQWTWGDAAQPLTFFLIETIMVYILYIKPRHK